MSTPSLLATVVGAGLLYGAAVAVPNLPRRVAAARRNALPAAATVAADTHLSRRDDVRARLRTLHSKQAPKPYVLAVEASHIT